MPFCRECGNVVEEDWVTCPFCTHSIGPPASNSSSPNIQDSVIMGDVNAGNELICPHCSSIGSVLIACVNCREISYCSTCEPEIKEQRFWDLLGMKGNWMFDDYDVHGCIKRNSRGWSATQKQFSSTRCCDDCWNKWCGKIQSAIAEEAYNWLGVDVIEDAKNRAKNRENMNEFEKITDTSSGLLSYKMKRLGFEGWIEFPSLDSINE
jgi:hypothetical protein